MGLWLVAGFGLWYFYERRGDAPLKRRLHPWLMGLAGAACLVFILAGIPLKKLGLGLPLLGAGLAFIVYLNIRLAQFCDGCGFSVSPRLFAPPLSSCPRCGASLGAAGPRRAKR